MLHSFYLPPQKAIARVLTLIQCPCMRTKVTYTHSDNVIRQSKILEKFFGNRLTGSKKRWYPLENNNAVSCSGIQQPSFVFQGSSFGKFSPYTKKHNTRRISVLNKLFMTKITDMLSTGAAVQSIVGLGLHVTRVKISSDFSHINVYWLGRTDENEGGALETELWRYSSQLQHELTQLRLMGKMPRIKFVRDKTANNLYQLCGILSNLNLNTHLLTKKCMDYSERQKVLSTYMPWPKMRQNVLELNHTRIVDKIICKIRKLKEAWVDHLQY
ncbi:uncharacterized protein LOC117186839 [Drosophila miranda]|uniref:uncharacterized protein LOC117186839 n=1 Tax=Drosophila miranda TaxID=7229 RepID=UPI00143F3B9C|nr:uncharacterized protein LOC117186839 [Drosophila miranda]